MAKRRSRDEEPSCLRRILGGHNAARELRLEVLQQATGNFDPAGLLGEGGFGKVYRGWIVKEYLGWRAATQPGEGRKVAVKRLDLGLLGRQGHDEWQNEVEYLGRLHHSNLIRLIGYCREGPERLLVYEFMEKGSLQDSLFGSRADQELLAQWSLRMKVALGTARGLAFLHGQSPTVILRDLKPGNILIDSEYNVKLSDFGMAREGPAPAEGSHISTDVVGTLAYMAPEYNATGCYFLASDVYAYGLVLLELVTGRSITDYQQPLQVQWATSLLRRPGRNQISDRPVDRRRIRLAYIDISESLVDRRLTRATYPRADALNAAALACRCASEDRTKRPSMEAVVTKLERLYENATRRVGTNDTAATSSAATYSRDTTGGRS